MAINFDKLPNSLPASEFPLIEKGVYVGTVEKAEMKQPKDANKPPYLSLTWNILDDAGKSKGKLFDIITESNNDYAMYKLRSFINAIDVNLGKEFELKDLTKVCVGKTCRIAITIDGKNDPPRNQVNIFHKDPYEKMLAAETSLKDESLPFEKPDEPRASNAKESY